MADQTEEDKKTMAEMLKAVSPKIMKSNTPRETMDWEEFKKKHPQECYDAQQKGIKAFEKKEKGDEHTPERMTKKALRGVGEPRGGLPIE